MWCESIIIKGVVLSENDAADWAAKQIKMYQPSIN